jgi:hypothetical protein
MQLTKNWMQHATLKPSKNNKPHINSFGPESFRRCSISIHQPESLPENGVTDPPLLEDVSLRRQP